MQLLKKPDRCDEGDSEKPKERVKKPERPNKEERAMGSGDHRKRQHIDNKEDRGRKLVTQVIFLQKQIVNWLK